MSEMGNLNLVAVNRVENEIPKARNDDHAHVRLVNLSVLIGRVLKGHCPIDQAQHNA